MKYHLRRLEDKLLVSSVSYESPLHELSSLTCELLSFDFHGEVIFDLFCVNGLSKNRFVSIFFDKEFNRKTKKPIKSKHLEDVQSDFYRRNESYVLASVMTPSMQNRFLSTSAR
ncbi:type II toxin-antitoxin system RnlB family antitoxin [Photobacterium sanguinicancri]|uniref:Uncharacterized protein n=1 Tax=Photobacterium sanguinicancri TaxID=875932 RepID=A0ABX4FUI9_9GAMM|nr:hypothetical protein ASV53_18200 [Photobacterium sanguinicancri]